MKICKLISTAGLPMAPRCYNPGKGYQWYREIMYRYGTILGHYLLNDIDAHCKLHVACNVADLDTLAKGVVDELEADDITYSLYWLDKRKQISAQRHHTKGRRDVCIIIRPILNEVFPTKAILNALSEWSHYEELYLVTPSVVGDANNTLMNILRDSIKKRLHIITLHVDGQMRFKGVSEYQPAVPDDKSEGTGFLLDTIRKTK